MCRHAEDLDLYSINYLHFGATKHWYVIPPEHKARFESVVKGLMPDLFKACPEFFRHKVKRNNKHLQSYSMCMPACQLVYAGVKMQPAGSTAWMHGQAAQAVSPHAHDHAGMSGAAHGALPAAAHLGCWQWQLVLQYTAREQETKGHPAL